MTRSDVTELYEAEDGTTVTPVDPPRGMLQYATDTERFYVTFKGAGRSPRSDTPRKVCAVYGRQRAVSVVGVGQVKVERITEHFKPVQPDTLTSR